MMEVKGTALVPVPVFIKSTFGEPRFNEWLNTLSPKAREVYSAPILSSSWFSLKEIFSEPTKQICDMFYHGQLLGASECGKFSADFALKGIYRIFVQLGSPEFFLDRAAIMLPTYYKPSKMQLIEKSKNSGTVRIVEFPEIDPYVEARIMGWINRALEISGCKNLLVRTTASHTKGQPYTEITATWN